MQKAVLAAAFRIGTSNVLMDDEALSLLQLRATPHHQRTTQERVNWAHAQIGGRCATTEFVTQEVLDSVLGDRRASEMGFCHCAGDPHCSHVPFDQQSWAKHGDDVSGWDGVNMQHYQYFHECASTYAKSAPGNPGAGGRWEIQIFMYGNEGGATWGSAVKVGGITLEAWGGPGPINLLANGEVQPTPSQFTGPVHLPNGLHYWHNGNDFCVLQEGQFLWHHSRGSFPMNTALLVPKSVRTQEAGTVCYDPTNTEAPLYIAGNPQHGKLLKNAQVSGYGLFTDYENHFGGLPRNWPRPRCSGAPAPVPPVTAEEACGRTGFDLTTAQNICQPLQENHPAFYDDCLMDECLFGEQIEDEEEMLEEVIEADEAFDADAVENPGDQAAAVGDPHLTTNLGKQYDPTQSTWKQ